MISDKIRKKRSKEAIHISVISSIISSVVSALLTLSMSDTVIGIRFVLGVLIGALLGFFVPFLYIHLIFKIQQFTKGRKVRYVVYVAVHFLLLFVIAGSLNLIIGWIFYRDYFMTNISYTLTYTCVLATIFVVFDTIKQFLGKDFIGNIFLGKYHIPKEKDMIVCFVDIRDSTTWAEVLGGQKFFDMINDFLQTVEQCADYCGGEIYKFLGDGIIVVWQTKNNSYEQALSFIRELKEEVESRQGYYQDIYGGKLGFSLGMHEGKLIVGELGLERKEIGYWGDTINTASRIANECKHQDALILISHYISEHFQENCSELLNDMKPSVIHGIMLRGKTNPVDLVKLY